MSTHARYSRDQIIQLLARQVRIFGSPATSENPTSSLLESEKGRFAEAAVANLLNVMAIEDPRLYVFHSVAVPGGTPGQTDHILVNGNRVFLIETKSFARYNAYFITKDGVLKAKTPLGKRFREIPDNHLYEKADRYRAMLPEGFVLQSIAVITRDNVETVSENGKYKVASLSDFMSLISRESAQAKPHPGQAGLLEYLASLCLQG